MSQETWRRKYYPVDARLATATEETALRHSLAKWRGLTESALRAHGLEDPPIDVDGSTCALCQRHEDASTGRLDCDQCSLTAVRGVPCDQRVVTGWSEPAPYTVWAHQNDPKPMLKLLRAALKAVVAKRKEKPKA